MTRTHDVIVIGAGAAGLTAAGGCARLGLRTALIERDRMGGECLHTGCVPSKALLAAAHRAHAMRVGGLGIAGQGAAVDFAAVRAHVQAAIAAIAPHDSPARFTRWGVEVIAGEAQFVDARTVHVAGRRLRAPRIVIAVGSRPAIPPIEGLARTPFLTNETLFELDTLPCHLVILGGGAIGIEMAQAFRRLGAAVTVIEAAGLLAGADREAASVVLRQLAADGVTLIENSPATRVAPDAGGVRVGFGDDRAAVLGSHLLVATGRRADLDALCLDRAGVAFGANGIRVDQRRRTTNPRITAIGDCRDGPRLTHAAGYEGSLAVMDIGLGLPAPARYEALPAVLYTEPELAQLGLTEQQARARHRRARVHRASRADNDRAVTQKDTDGFIKVITAHRRIVGVTIVGGGAGELVLPWSLAMRGRASLWALSGMVVPYPTLSELSKAAAFAACEPVIFQPATQHWARLLARLRR